ncbi:hypothetical protein RHSIM_Rhsim10G0095100 [Rhododendron simsii]|uniref:VQ domain-containing protein n=1 Tax=Rhododendron simsii TaxID=118357 RepID=A0A834LD30_RHOSS|nr:hypothetical protein RHSIM_Rhsim10G0095100 [Rhododendron simsii]
MVSASYSASSSSSSTTTTTTTTKHSPCPQERNTFKPPPPPSPAPHFHSSLHSVRKLSTKIMKEPIAPLPPTPRRVYKVDPLNFKRLVQKLTAAPEFQSRRLESVSPPPLRLSTNTVSDKPSTTLEVLPTPIAITPTMSETYSELMSEKLEIQAWKQSDSLATANLMGFSPSPMSHAWYWSSEILDTQPFSLDTEPWKQSESLAIGSLMGSSLSPSSHLWCSFPLLSPGTVSSLEKGM